VTGTSVSVVVVSRERPGLLQTCLKAISQLRYDNFELVVVADKAGIAAVKPRILQIMPRPSCLKSRTCPSLETWELRRLPASWLRL